MTTRPAFSALLCLWLAAPGISAEAVAPPASLGPLDRTDPAAFKPPGLLAVHGDPLRGLPAPAGQRMQRIGDTDQWWVESGNHLARIERDRESGDMRLREILAAEAEWCLSPDGKRLFAARWAPDGMRKVNECLDLASGRPLWAAPAGLHLSDAVFSRDGRSLIVLHPVAADAEGRATAVSWWDAETGERRREVRLPGTLYQISGSLATDYLAESDRALYVAVPRENDEPEGWSIPAAGGEPVRLEWDKTVSEELANVRVGGERRELLAVYTDDVLELFREAESGPPVRLLRLDVARESAYSSDRNVRFSPDHRELLVADCEKTLLVALPVAGRPEVKRLVGGNGLGDYTRDGRYFVTVDDGGGVIRDRATLERVDQAKLREFPEHCCPITDAGFSITGRWILSNDRRSLLLWTREGDIVAELASPNEEVRPRIDMQSPVIVERLRKIYAADGWNFIEWDLDEVDERRRKFPGFQPRVVGKVVFGGRKPGQEEPEHMTLGLDKSGKRLVTATRTTFVYRDLDDPAAATRLQVADRDVFMRPREIRIPDAGGEVLLKSASELLGLDPKGKKPPRLLSQNCAAAATPAGRSFDVLRIKGEVVVAAKAFGDAEPGEDRMTLPGRWQWASTPVMRATPDGRWLVMTRPTHTRSSPCSLVVVDWEKKKIAREIPLPWMATTLELSGDATRLLVGSFNRSLYEFDLGQLRADP